MDLSLIDWSRAQFALTAMFHWIFVPLTLGLGLIVCIYEAIYYKKGDEKWKTLTKFWMKLFGINFAIGVATGIILEFEFGTNWSNYSYFVGDIFGAPLAIEGIVAFFLEATFIGVMFFGWNKFSKGFHLASTCLAVGGATMSAWWILVANAWMQFPAGMDFNPDTMRNELTNFWEVAFSPVAVNKFFHTVISSWMLGAAFVIGICSYFLLKGREKEFSFRSIKIAAIVGVLGIVLSFITGDSAAKKVAVYQPMKLAAMEGLYEGNRDGGTYLIGFGIINPAKRVDNQEQPVFAKIAFPNMLSWLAFGDTKAFVPGIKDIIDGEYPMPDGSTALSVQEKMAQGKLAQETLKNYRAAMAASDIATAQALLPQIDENIHHFGYGFFKDAKEAIPPIGLTFYAFHLMVILGGYFLIFFIVIWILNNKRKFDSIRWMQWIGLISIPLAYTCSQAGWIVAEVGRQPWAIQDVLPLSHSVSSIPSANVKITFFIFLILFSILLVAEVGIMIKAIKAGPQEEQDNENY
ncbi:MAG: cytochrome ubiquinol oxidase subunit I [Prevotellaceae bacterium]|jgi:cytochrome d ubiquinol oxidase subunit I|nr:cytochrome ubiquinol oxidase subunit I [Prevotellaceae bacterium]